MLDYEQSLFFSVRRSKRFAARDRSARALPLLNLKNNKDHSQSRILQWTPESRSILQTMETNHGDLRSWGNYFHARARVWGKPPFWRLLPILLKILLVLMTHRLLRLQS